MHLTPPPQVERSPREQVADKNKDDLTRFICDQLTSGDLQALGYQSMARHANKIYLNHSNGNRFEITVKWVSEAFGANTIVNDGPVTGTFD